MISNRSYVVGSLVACSLTLSVSIGNALAHERWSRNGGEKQIRTSRSDLQRDEEQLAADVSYLRNSLRRHKSPELIEKLRYQVRQDWRQIVLDREPSESEPADQTSNLVNRRHKRNAHTG